MMTCRELAELLIDFVSDELPPDVRARLERHLRACPPCESYLETYQITIRLTRKLPDVAPPPELLERLRRAIEGECSAGQ
jgi:anti-sigma factor RsiW